MILAIGLAPVALDLCQATCGAHGIAAVAGPVAHDHQNHAREHADSAPTGTPAHQHTAACHDNSEAPPLARQGMQGLPHGCSHSDDLSAWAGTSPQHALAPPAVVATTLASMVPEASMRSWTDRVPLPIPLRLAAITQLRV